MYITNNTNLVSYNLTELLPTYLDPSIYNPNSTNLTYFCNVYNLTLSTSDTWIDQITTGYRCGRYLNADYAKKHPDNNEITYNIFTEAGGNITDVKYPCFQIEESFNNNTIWTVNIGRAILCGTQMHEADLIILSSIDDQQQQQQSSSSSSGPVRRSWVMFFVMYVLCPFFWIFCFI
ncbi:hypothetical protein G210_1921 [Candida maltosa Xu316]|uniref:Uncharacterized protein n=1 Tax=Candida maltosa (strain Xu316) TaxID=1245528 RepID=M3JXI8_CANMX|nr:hypothetical protein G210_1921 [Candida maltosa Xu316]